MPNCPQYRNRVFLSVDLVGSTAFKGGVGGEQIDGSAHPLWVEEIRKFYQEFPTTVRKHYAHQTALVEYSHYSDSDPLVWKTVGDEIIFCSRIRSRDHLVCSVHAFMKSLDEYGGVLEARGGHLDVKGAAWLAAFPAPNVTVEIFFGAGESEVNSDLPDEDLEVRADIEPHKFDFLGKGIDCGFRLAKYASTDKLALSAELALALCESDTSSGHRFAGRFNYLGREELKGVIGGRPYPVVAIDTERSPLRRIVSELEHNLDGRPFLTAINLGSFLRHLMTDEGIEPAILPIEGTIPQPDLSPLAHELPKSYCDFRSAWESAANESEKRNKGEIAAANAGDEGGSVPQEVEAALDELSSEVKEPVEIPPQ